MHFATTPSNTRRNASLCRKRSCRARLNSPRIAILIHGITVQPQSQREFCNTIPLKATESLRRSRQRKGPTGDILHCGTTASLWSSAIAPKSVMRRRPLSRTLVGLQVRQSGFGEPAATLSTSEGFFIFIAATGRLCAHALPARICSSPIRARRRNGCRARLSAHRGGRRGAVAANVQSVNQSGKIGLLNLLTTLCGTAPLSATTPGWQARPFFAIVNKYACSG